MLYAGASNRIEKLVDALLAEIRNQRQKSGRGFYEKVHILTPNPTVNKFLEFELAKRDQVLANVEFTHLHKFLHRMAENHPDLQDVTVLNRAQIQVLIQEVLLDADFMTRPEMAPVRAYIEVVDDPTGQQTRRYQFSLQLARFFEEYDYSRQKMLTDWSENRNCFEDEATEIWQRAIWHQIFGSTRIVERGQKRFVPLSTVFETYRRTNAEIPNLKHLHIFGSQHLSLTILNALQSLARTIDIHLWVLQPGPVETEQRPWTFINHAHPAVSLWAASAADMLAVLSQEPEAPVAFKNLHQPLETTTSCDALEALQADIYKKTTAAPSVQNPAGSIVFHACPGVQREIEIIADDIWRRVLESDGTLKFHEIGVVVAGADREEYVAQIRSVFKTFYSLPRSFVGLPNAEKSPVVEAFSMLLDLPFTNFGRRSFMNLLLHPNVQASVPGSDPQAWKTWCASLSILFGADHAHQGETYIEKDFYNWSQGLKRLTLGTFLSVQADDAIAENERLNSFQHGSHTYLVEAVTQSQVPDAARMATLASSLIEDARWLHDTSFTLTQWAAVFENLLETYVRPAGNHAPGSRGAKKDHGDIGLCKHVIQSLIARDITGQVVPYRTVSLMLLTELDALDISREGELHRGVVVGTASRLSHIPFKHTYIVGFGEGQFPAIDRDNPMDLRQLEEHLGDETARNRDRQIFLNLVLNARVSLSMSWVARDATTGEDLEPSSLLHELRSCLQELVAGESREAVDKKLAAIKHPLRRYDAPQTLHPEAQIEAHMVMLGQSLRREQIRAVDKALPTAFTVAEYLRNSTEPGHLRIEKLLQLPAALPLAESQKAEPQRSARPIRVSLSQLRSFLESPLQGAAKIQLRMNEEQDDALLVANEPFAVDRMNSAVFLRRVFDEAVLRGFENVDFEVLYNEMLLPFYELNGTLPTGIFLEKARREHVRILERWKHYSLQWIESKLWAGTRTVQAFHFGNEEQPGTQRLDPLTFEVDVKGVATRVELVGTTELFCTAAGTLITCVTSDKPNKKHFSRGYVSYLALSASGYKVNRILINFTSDKKVQQSTINQLRGELDLLAPEDACLYLQRILQEILGEPHAYLLPLDMLNEYMKKPDAFDAPGWVMDELEKEPEYLFIADRYGPIKNYADFQAPPDWKDKLGHRFRYFPDFLEAMKGESK